MIPKGDEDKGKYLQRCVEMQIKDFEAMAEYHEFERIKALGQMDIRKELADDCRRRAEILQEWLNGWEKSLLIRAERANAKT